MRNALLNVIEQTPAAGAAGFVRPAQVIEALPDGGFSVAVEEDGRTLRRRAQAAMPAAGTLGTGARVLIAGEGPASCYIIGVLGPVASGQDTAPALATRCGASTRVVEQDGADRIEVRDPEGRIVFEYCPDSGAGILSVPEGDLRLRAPKGNIDLYSGKAILCRGETVALSGTGGDAAAPATLNLGHGLTELSSPRLEVAAGHAEVAIRESRFQGKLLKVTVTQAKQIYGKLETVAARLLERAGDVYRQVDNLHQLKAGRMRTLVKGACHIKGGRTSIKADDDVKIAGRRIHLG